MNVKTIRILIKHIKNLPLNVEAVVISVALSVLLISPQNLYSSNNEWSLSGEDDSNNKTLNIERNQTDEHAEFSYDNTTPDRIRKSLLYSWAIKTNLLYDALTNISLGAECLVAEQYSIDLPIGLNIWTYKNNRKLKNILVQPELRYWTNEGLKGSFWGLHAHWSYYNAGNIKFPFKLNNRYQGWLAGGGISYGYRWHLNEKFAFEGSLGAGYAYMKYSKYEPETCGAFIEKERKHYLGITKIALNLIYKF